MNILFMMRRGNSRCDESAFSGSHITTNYSSIAAQSREMTCVVQLLAPNLFQSE